MRIIIKVRIKEATQYIPKEQICISPQCGFASTHHGNKLTENEQWEKLKFIVDIAKEELGYLFFQLPWIKSIL